jgi:hypothetical protein
MTSALVDEIRDQRYGFRMVELDAAFEPLARDDRGHGHKQLVLFTGRQVHLLKKFLK